MLLLLSRRLASRLASPSQAVSRLSAGRLAAVAGGCTACAACVAATPALAAAAPAADAPGQPEGAPGKEDIEEGPLRYAAYARRAVQAFLVKGRLAAYTSDVGESVRPVVPSWIVRACYGMTWLYVAVDVGYNTSEAYLAGKPNETIARTAVHATVFQVIASVLVPSLIIHQAVHMAQHAVHGRIPPGRIATWLPSVFGLCLIPLLPYVDEPCEHLIEVAFDKVWPPVEGEEDEKAKQH